MVADHLNTFGEGGLLDMPDARMAPDGELALSGAGIDAGQRIALTFQALPWLETEFRYSRIPRLNPGETTLYDRSLGFKIRLFQETRWTPDFSLGVRDVLGTGIYGAEYFAATKRVAQFDLTGGLGWGRLAGSATFGNPFAALFPSFKERSVIPSGGGLPDLRQLFHGPNMGAFGGAAWHTPIDQLSLSAEYSSDRYMQEQAAHTISVRIPFNFGVTYRFFDNADITAGWFYGNSFGALLSLKTDPTVEQYTARLAPAVPAPVIRTAQQRERAISEGLFERDVKALDPSARITPGGSKLMVEMRAAGNGKTYCSALSSLARGIGAVRLDLKDRDASEGVSTCPIAANPVVVGPSSRKDHARGGLTNNLDAHPLETANWSELEKQIRKDAAAQGLQIELFLHQGTELTIDYTDTRYQFEDDAIGRLVRILMADTPASVESFDLVPVYDGMPVQDVRILRSSLERLIVARATPDEAPGAVTVRAASSDNPELDVAEKRTYPRFNWTLSPGEQTGIFDPTAPLRFRLFAAASGNLDVRPGVSIEGSYELTAYDTFTTATPPESLLPHVRTDIAQYFTKGRDGFSTLAGVWHKRLAPELFAEAKIGYIEDMFGGAGGQVLWRPEGDRFAIGTDLYEVWQRNFDRLFGFQGYHVLTGHVTVYYRSPWYGINMAVHVGRYLAGDRGATLEISREFLTGVQIGAYATFTNVPFSTFGEGGFDKGIFLRIPIHWGFPLENQGDEYMNIESLTRDGGQRLEYDDSLYQETDRTSFDEISEHRDNIVTP